MPAIPLVWLALFACNLNILPVAVDPPCAREAVYYPPEGTPHDGEAEVYIGCDPPAGWTTTAPEVEDTGAPPDTASEDPGER